MESKNKNEVTKYDENISNNNKYVIKSIILLHILHIIKIVHLKINHILIYLAT